MAIDEEVIWLDEPSELLTIPIHPEERHLPRSQINLQCELGGLITLTNIPMQGPKTLAMLRQTLELWEECLVMPELDYQI